MQLDALGDYIVSNGIQGSMREPIVKEADDSVDSPALIADLSARVYGNHRQWRCLMFVSLTLTPSHILIVM